MRLRGIFWRAGVNGCGVWKIRTPYHKRFERECCLHDLMYDDGGTGYSRLVADRTLYKGMLDNANGDAWLGFVALMYYVNVRLLGWAFFNYKD